MIKKVFRPAVYNDYDPIFIKKALVKSNEIYKGGLTVKQIDDVYDTILATLNNWPEDEASVEKINDLVIAALREKKFIKLSDMYAMHKSKMQNISSTSIKLSEKLGEVSKETDRSNANVGNNFSGKLLQLASEASKWYNLHNVIPQEQAKEHQKRIYIHDLDSYNLTYNCSQIPLAKMLKNGFNTGEGFMRSPKRITSAAELTSILIQTCQNEQFGGISVDNFDNALAKYFIMSLKENEKELKEFKVPLKSLKKAAWEKTILDARRAMKGVVYNLNSMHSRAGAQIPFSSLNIGVPFSKEAAIICQLFLEEFEKGLGFGETPIFPNVIFRLIDGINKKPQDPYYDLFKLACRVSSTRMNPTFLNCNAGGLSRFTKRILKDAKLDKDGKLLNEPKSKEIDYAKCIKYMEQGTDLLPVRMGCRTSVLANINGFETGSGRGNIAPCTINLPRLSIFVFEEKNKEKRVQKFFEEFDKSINLAKDNLVHRFNVLSNLKVKDIPFNIGQAELLGSEEIMYDKFSSIKSVLKQGSFAIGYVGMAECLKGLLGKHHGEDEESEEMAIQILQHLTKRCEEFKQQYQLNFSVYATPAESVASRVFYTDIAEFGEEKFTKIFGKENAEKGFYTNSSHIPVDFKISYVDKIKKEAPLHRLSPAGAIFYLEFDSTPSVETTMKIVSYIATTDIEYYGLNYSIVYCPHCLQRMALGELTKEEYNKMHKKHACSKC